MRDDEASNAVEQSSEKPKSFPIIGIFWPPDANQFLNAKVNGIDGNIVDASCRSWKSLFKIEKQPKRIITRAWAKYDSYLERLVSRGAAKAVTVL